MGALFGLEGGLSLVTQLGHSLPKWVRFPLIATTSRMRRHVTKVPGSDIHCVEKRSTGACSISWQCQRTTQGAASKIGIVLIVAARILATQV